MTIPSGLFRARLTFTLGSPVVEQAVMGFHLRNADAVSDSNCALMAIGVQDAWLAHMSSTLTHFGTHVKAKDVMVYALGTDNHATHAGGAVFAPSGTGSWVGTGSTSLPWECSAVASLHAYAAGAFTSDPQRKRGRYYLPPMTTDVLSGADGIIQNDIVDELQAKNQAFLEQVNGVYAGMSEQTRVVILSAGARERHAHGTPLGALKDGIATDVITVSMTSTMHSQRRREKSQAVNHSAIGTLAA